MRSRRHKVTLRRSHAVYRWRSALRALGWLLRAAAVAAAGAYLFSAANGFWRESPWLRIRRVETTGAAPAALGHELGVRAGDHLFGFSAGTAAARLMEAHPELARVGVDRRWNRTLRVTAEERVPLARVWENGRWEGVDADGFVFPLRSARFSPEDLPVLSGASGNRAAEVLRFVGALRDAGADWPRDLLKVKDDAGGVTFFLKDGTPVRWGEAPVEDDVLRKKADRLARVLAHEALAEGAEYVRFVDEDRIAVKIGGRDPAAGDGKRMESAPPSAPAPRSPGR
ncbi:MAG: cell division protein FtsQ/DivIB [Elusimicrobiota bacterium]